MADSYNFTVDGLYQRNLVESPEVAVIKYQFLHPVNYSTGTVDIKIPLFDIECGSLTLPIYLSYNTAGLKVSEPYGWVGQNWSLHAEPILTRVVKGHIDQSWHCNFNPSENTYFWARLYLDNNYNSSIDAMPDEYYFSLLSGGGMFISCKKDVSSNGEFVCIPYDDIKITSPTNLVTPDGTSYSYNGAIDYSVSPNYPIAWHASKVTGSNGVDCINFTYDNSVVCTTKRHDDYITVVDAIENTYISDHSCTNRQVAMASFPFDPEMCMPLPIVYITHDSDTNSFLYLNNKLVSDDGAIERQYYYPDVTTRLKHLSQIRYKDNVVEFIMDNNKKVLKCINVKNSSGTKRKTITFSYTNRWYREYLTEIKISSEENDVSERYQFEYVNEYVPNCGSREFDFWGYFNNSCTDYSSTLVPSMKLYTSVYGNTRDDIVDMRGDSIILGCSQKRGSNEQYSRNGMLKTITYPTGAKESFTFESNRARLGVVTTNYGNSEFKISDQLFGENGIFQLGGLRIKEISIEDTTGILKKRSFVYGENEDGAGVTPIKEGINYFIKKQTKIYPEHPGIANHYATANYRTLSSFPVYPITFSNGASVMYSKVTEYNGTPEVNTRKTVYHYNIPDSVDRLIEFICENDLWDPNVKYHSWYQDNIMRKEVYEDDGAGYVLKQSDTFSYIRVNKNGYKAHGRQFRLDSHENFQEGDLNNISHLTSHAYKDYWEPIYTNLLYSSSHSEYYNNNIITTSTRYSYGEEDNQVTNKYTSIGTDVLKESYLHPKDMGNEEPYHTMVERNIISPDIRTQCYHNDTLFLEKTQEYDTFHGSMYLPSRLYYRTPEMSEKALRTTCDYDTFGNPVVITENHSSKRIIWDERGERILAVVIAGKSGGLSSDLVNNCTNLLRAADTANHNGTVSVVNIDSILSGGGRNCHITIFGYDQYDRLAYVRKPNGQLKYYSYDGLHRLVEVRNTSEQILEEYVYHNVNIN